jgi:hypothetical protein
MVAVVGESFQETVLVKVQPRHRELRARGSGHAARGMRDAGGGHHLHEGILPMPLHGIVLVQLQELHLPSAARFRASVVPSCYARRSGEGTVEPRARRCVHRSSCVISSAARLKYTRMSAGASPKAWGVGTRLLPSAGVGHESGRKPGDVELYLVFVEYFAPCIPLAVIVRAQV